MSGYTQNTSHVMNHITTEASYYPIAISSDSPFLRNTLSPHLQSYAITNLPSALQIFMFWNGNMQDVHFFVTGFADLA